MREQNCNTRRHPAMQTSPTVPANHHLAWRCLFEPLPLTQNGPIAVLFSRSSLICPTHPFAIYSTSKTVVRDWDDRCVRSGRLSWDFVLTARHSQCCEEELRL